MKVLQAVVLTVWVVLQILGKYSAVVDPVLLLAILKIPPKGAVNGTMSVWKIVLGTPSVLDALRGLFSVVMLFDHGRLGEG